VIAHRQRAGGREGHRTGRAHDGFVAMAVGGREAPCGTTRRRSRRAPDRCPARVADRAIRRAPP
jgi:hypothetical protein